MAFNRLSALGILLGSALSLAAAGCGGGIENGDYVLMRVAFADTKEDASCYANGEIPKEIKDDSTTLRTGSTLVLYRAPEEVWYLELNDRVMEGTREGDTFTFEGKSVDVEYQNGKPAELIRDTDHDGLEDFNDPMIDADKDGLDDQGIDDEVDLDADGLDDRGGQDDEVDVDGDGVDDRFSVVSPATNGDKYSASRADTVSFTIANESVSGSANTVLKVTCKGDTCAKKLPSCTQDVEFVGTVVKDATIEHQL